MIWLLYNHCFKFVPVRMKPLRKAQAENLELLTRLVVLPLAFLTCIYYIDITYHRHTKQNKIILQTGVSPMFVYSSLKWICGINPGDVYTHTSITVNCQITGYDHVLVICAIWSDFASLTGYWCLPITALRHKHTCTRERVCVGNHSHFQQTEMLHWTKTILHGITI